ncbi:hypothetical protein WDW37_05725 [Bdellovibrionota bacterium FG-1]
MAVLRFDVKGLIKDFGIPGSRGFGLVWFGLVWFGLVWFGLVWFGLVWFGLASI